jgi:hypothetical protein
LPIEKIQKISNERLIFVSEQIAYLRRRIVKQCQISPLTSRAEALESWHRDCREIQTGNTSKYAKQTLGAQLSDNKQTKSK